MMAPDLAWELAMHMIGRHCNAAAVASDWAENAGLHRHEHDGPGGIRNHPRGDLSFDPETVEAVLEEAEEMDEPLLALLDRSKRLQRL